MREWLRRWLLEAPRVTLSALRGADIGETSAHSQPETAHTRFGVLEVMNGRVLEVCSFKRNPHGPDWTTTYWILSEDQPLADQLAVVMKLKGLSK